MAREARTFSRITEAEKMVADLCEMYPDELWAVQPSTVCVMGVDNQERTEKAVKKNPVYAKLRPIKGAEKAILRSNDIRVLYVIELYCSDWNGWSDTFRQWVLFDKLLEISHEDEKRNTPDCVGFRMLMDVAGVNWDRNSGLGIPDLLSDKVDFDLTLRPGLAEADEAEEDEDDS